MGLALADNWRTTDLAGDMPLGKLMLLLDKGAPEDPPGTAMEQRVRDTERNLFGVVARFVTVNDIKSRSE